MAQDNYINIRGLSKLIEAIKSKFDGLGSAIGTKVDKVSGKGLSTNDYTTSEKNKLAGIASGAEANVQSDWNATSGDAFIKNKPTIPSAVTESTVSGWGFTKNTGTYSKPSTGIPKTDLADGVQNSLRLADSAIQGHQLIYPLSIKDSAGNTFKTYTPNSGSATITINKDVVGLGNVTNDAQVKRSEMGVASGVATLGTDGKVPTSQLPSYVDDTIEGYLHNSKFYKETAHTTQITGESGKIYVDLATNKTYRWSGSAFVEISASLALGTTSSSAYPGDLGAQNATNISSLQSSVSTLQGYFDSTAAKIAKQTLYSLTVGSKTFNGSSAITITKADLGLSNVGDFKAVSTVASQGLTSTEKSNARANIGAGTSNFDGAYSSLSGKPTIPTKVSELENDKAYLSSHQSIYGLTIKSSGGQTVQVYTPNQKSAAVTLTKDIVGLGNVENKSSETIRSEITKANVTSALGTGTGTTKYLREDGTWVTPPDTTYSSKTAASGGTDVSLVTTGEKYEWNNKQNAISDLSTIRSNASNGATAYGWGNHASAGYQKASTAITTSNIGSQSVASAAKLTTARTIALGTGVKGEATSFNGTGNITIPVTEVKEAYLTWGGRNLSGSISPIDAAYSNIHSANRFAFAYPAGITIEYSTNGSTYSTYSTTDAAKVNLVSGVGSEYLIGARSTSTTVNDKLRITLNATSMGVYTRLRKILINIVTNYATGSYVIVERAMKGSETTFSTIGAYGISGWSGWNSIPIDAPFGGTSNQTGNIAVLRLTFGITGVNSEKTPNALTIRDIVGIGDTYWTYPSTMAKTGHLYTYDSSQNATFPANVTATTFVGALSGNASTATNVAWSGVTGKPSFATVATSGSYNDLSNKPTLATTSANGLMSSSMVTQLNSAATNASNAYALAQQAVAGLSAAPTMSQTTVTSFGTSGMAFNTSYSNSNISFTKVGKIVNIQGAFTFSYTTNKDYAICAIPSGYNPNHNISSWQYITNNGMWRAHIGQSTSGTWTLYLHSIRTSSGAVVETSSRTFVINITYTVA